MDLNEAKQILKNAGFIMESATGLDEFIEDLSNCVGHIVGDEVVFKKSSISSEYVVRTRNHNRKIANIWYDYDKNKIVVQLVPEFSNYEFDREELTTDKCKEIGAMIKTKVKELDEAKKFLRNNGFILEDTAFYQCKDFPFYLNEYCIVEGKIVNTGKRGDRTFDEIAKDFKAAANKEWAIIFSKITFDDAGYPHFKVVCRRSEEDIRATYVFLESRMYKIVFDGISFCYKATTDSEGNKDYVATSDKRIGPEICNYSISKVLAAYMNLVNMSLAD